MLILNDLSVVLHTTSILEHSQDILSLMLWLRNKLSATDSDLYG